MELPLVNALVSRDCRKTTIFAFDARTRPVASNARHNTTTLDDAMAAAAGPGTRAPAIREGSVEKKAFIALFEEKKWERFPDVDKGSAGTETDAAPIRRTTVDSRRSANPGQSI
jgi:hypothetical protein